MRLEYIISGQVLNGQHVEWSAFREEMYLVRSFHKDIRHGQILEAASLLFRKQGFDGTPMSEIAEAVGISKAGIYYHFRTKDDILHALLDPGFDQVEELLNQHQPASNSSPEQRAFLEAYFDHILQNRELMVLLVSDPAVLSHPEIGTRAMELNDQLVELVAGAEASSEGQIKATLALGALQIAVIRFFKADPQIVREQGLKAAERVLEGKDSITTEV